MSNQVIKINFGSKEINVQAPSDFEEFKSLCQSEFSLDDLSNFIVQYKDDDGDDVNVDNESDYDQALNYMNDSKTSIDFTIKEKLNKSRTYTEINNDEVDPMRSAAIFQKIPNLQKKKDESDDEDDDEEKKKEKMESEMKKYKMELEEQLKKEYNKKLEDTKREMEEKSKKIEDLWKEKEIEDLNRKEDEQKKIEEEKKKIEEEKLKLAEQLKEIERKKIEEEERKKKEKEEEEERKKKEEEERIQKEKEEEEERKRKEEEERIQKEKEEEEERKRKEEEERKKKEEEDELARQKQIVLDAIEEEKKNEKKQLLKPSNNNEFNYQEASNQMINQIFDKFNNEEVKDEEEDLKMSNQIMIQKKEELLEKLKHAPEDFNVEFYTGQLNNLIEQLNNNYYLNNISEKEINTFDINQITEDFLLKGYEPKILISYPKEEGKDTITGLCKFSYENEFGRSKIIINHISSINRDEHENDWIDQIELIIKYIIQNLNFNELLLVLTYSKNENEEPVIDQDIKELFEKKLKFKWSNIENLKDLKRTQTLQYMKQEEPLNIQDQFISIDTLSIITLTEYQHYQEVNIEQFINIFTIYALLAEKTAKNNIKIEKKNENGILLESSKINQYLKNIIHYYFDINDKNQINEILNDKVDFNLDSIIYNNEPCDLVTMKLNPQLQSRITIKYKNYYYNRIETEIGVLREPKTNGKFYFIPTNDHSLSIMICELNSELKNEFLYKNKNIYEYFYSFYSQFIQDQETKNVIYIPSFNLEGNIFSNGLPIIEKTININDNNDTPMLFDTVDELFKVNMNVDPDLKNSFTTSPNSDDIIITDAFLFGICNLNILTNNNIPLIQLFIVTKDYWKKI